MTKRGKYKRYSPEFKRRTVRIGLEWVPMDRLGGLVDGDHWFGAWRATEHRRFGRLFLLCVVLQGAGHTLMTEAPNELLDALKKLLQH